MGAVLRARGNTKAIKLNRGGFVYIRAQKAEGTGYLRLKLEGALHALNRDDNNKKSNPFYEFKRQDEGIWWVDLH